MFFLCSRTSLAGRTKKSVRMLSNVAERYSLGKQSLLNQ